jgi:hypothetical protein
LAERIAGMSVKLFHDGDQRSVGSAAAGALAMDPIANTLYRPFRNTAGADHFAQSDR